MTEPPAFETFAGQYDQWFEQHPDEYALELEAVRQLLPAGEGVEIGAGSGRFAQPLGVALGVEPSAAMGAIARRRGVRMVAASAESLPIGNAVYDYALMLTTVCFLASPELAFREAHRVLRAGGYLLVGLIDKDSPLGRRYERDKRQSRFYRHARFHSVKTIKGTLAATGFGDIRTVQTLIPTAAQAGYTPLVKPGDGEGAFVVLRGRKQ